MHLINKVVNDNFEQKLKEINHEHSHKNVKDMSNKQYKQFQKKFEQAQQMVDIPKNVSLQLKLESLDKVHIRDKDLVFGITPGDFIIRKKLNLIDTEGITQNFDRF